MLQVNQQAKNVKPRLILNFLCFLALIIHELGLGDNFCKGNWESTKLKKFKPELNFDL